MRKRLIGRCSVGALVGLGLAVAGCGSSTSSSTSTSTATKAAALTKVQYLAYGNAICKQGSAAQQAALLAYLKQQGVNPNAQLTNAQVTKAAKAVAIPRIQAQINRIKALGAPSGDQQTVNAMLAAAQSDLDKVKHNPALFGSGNQFADAGKLLHGYGLTACAPNR
jgi:hypothetical protein